MMGKSIGHIIAMALPALILFASCGKDEEEVIPRDTLADIYAEMLLTDQWIISTPNVRSIADTSLVYEPILEKYGYDSKDYRKSVDFYMDDPERFARILKESGEILRDRMADLTKRKEEMDRIKSMRLRAERYRPDIKWEEIFPYLGDEPYVHYYDSIAFEADTLNHVYRLVPVALSDTLYDGVRMVLKDTVAVVEDTVSESVVKKEAIHEDMPDMPRKPVSRKLAHPDFRKIEDYDK